MPSRRRRGTSVWSALADPESLLVQSHIRGPRLTQILDRYTNEVNGDGSGKPLEDEEFGPYSGFMHGRMPGRRVHIEWFVLPPRHPPRPVSPYALLSPVLSSTLSFL